MSLEWYDNNELYDKIAEYFVVSELYKGFRYDRYSTFSKMVSEITFGDGYNYKVVTEDNDSFYVVNTKVGKKTLLTNSNEIVEIYEPNYLIVRLRQWSDEDMEEFYIYCNQKRSSKYYNLSSMITLSADKMLKLEEINNSN